MSTELQRLSVLVGLNASGTHQLKLKVGGGGIEKSKGVKRVNITTSLDWLAQTNFLLHRIFSKSICDDKALWCNDWRVEIVHFCDNWCMTNGSKLEPRKQTNKALKPECDWTLNLLWTILKLLMLSRFLLQMFFQFVSIRILRN